MYVAVSAGGVYRTEDGGATWQARNNGVRVVFLPEKYPEFGQCVHKIVLHESRPERLFLQNHWGLYRSDNRGDSWQDIARGVPSDFGFAMIVHPHDADCVYIVPVESEEFRCTPEGHLRVYRTRNAGGSWEALSRGLPQKGAYETVLRDAMSADSLDPAGIYFGTRSGKIYASRDEGKSWKKIVEGLPQILCVKAAVVQMDGAPAARPAVKSKPPRKQKTPRQKASGAGNHTDAGLVQYSWSAARVHRESEHVRVEVEAGVNLLQALQVLFVTYPGLRDRVMTENRRSPATRKYLCWQ